MDAAHVVGKNILEYLLLDQKSRVGSPRIGGRSRDYDIDTFSTMISPYIEAGSGPLDLPRNQSATSVKLERYRTFALYQSRGDGDNDVKHSSIPIELRVKDDNINGQKLFVMRMRDIREEVRWW